MLTIDLPNDVEQTLAQIAESTGKSKNYFAKEVLLSYLANLKNKPSWQATGKTTLLACQDSLNGEMEVVEDPFDFLETKEH